MNARFKGRAPTADRVNRGTTIASRGGSMLALEELESRLLLAVAPSGPEFQVNSHTPSYQNSVEVASDADGDFVVIWHSRYQDGSDYGVYGQRYNAAGQKQGSEFLVNTTTSGRQKFPDVAMDADGDFVVVWQNGGPSSYGVYAQRYNAAGQRQGGEFLVNTTTQGTHYSPQVAMTPVGNFIVTWDTDGGPLARRYAADGSPQSGEITVYTSTTGLLMEPVIAAAPDGSFTIAWDALSVPPGGLPTSDLRAQRFNASGQKIGGEFLVNTFRGGLARWGSLGYAADGSLTVAFSIHDNGNEHIWARQYDVSGAARGPEFRIEEKGSHLMPSLTVEGDGDFAVAWTALRPSGEQDVAYRRFNAADVPQGLELRANTFTAGRQSLPSIVGDADGDLVVVWTSEQQDGQDNGVFGQRVTNVIDPATVGGVVWEDLDADGTRNAGEPGLDGVEVHLFTAAGAMAGAAVTSDGGRYSFANLRGGEAYTVQFVAPATQQFTSEGQGPETVDSDANQAGRTPPLSLEAGASNLTLDAGLLKLATLGGLVWNDANANGVQDPTEVGRNGVAVQLHDEAGTLVASAVTAGGGLYQIAGVMPGRRYYLAFTPPANQALAPQDQGTDNALDSDPDPLTRRTPLITPASGQMDDSWDAGLTPAASVSGVAFLDADGDSQRGPLERPLAGWRVFIDVNGDDQLDALEVSRTTDAAGVFFITGLPGGTHRLALAPPRAGWAMTTAAAGRTRTLTPGAGVTNLLLGARPQGAMVEPTPLGPFQFVHASLEGSQSAPATAADAAGNSVVVWLDRRGPADGLALYGRLYDAQGAPRSGEILLEIGDVDAVSVPSVAMESDGDFVVAWRGSNDIYARRFNAAGAPQGARFKVNESAGNQTGGSVATDPTGGFVIAWNGQTVGDDQGVALRQYDAAGNAKGPEVRANDVTSAVEFPVGVGVDATGRITLGYASSGQSLYLRRFGPDGAALSDSGRVNVPRTGGPSGVLEGALTVDAAGNAAVAWLSADNNVNVRLYQGDGAPLGDDFRANTFANNVQDGPALAFGAGGRLLVAWASNSQDGDGNGIYAQLFDGAGVAQGREFRVNTATEFSQQAPAIAGTPSGPFTVVWHHLAMAQTPTRDDIYAQRISAFPDAQRAGLGDLVWNDTDGFGVRDAGETGQDGIKVELYTAAGSIVETVVTAGGGLYRFTSLQAGESYTVRFFPPNTKVFTRRDSGGLDTTDSDVDPMSGLSGPLTAPAAGTLNNDLDAGLVNASSISGVLFHDADADGVRDVEEAVLPGWAVFLDIDADGQLDPGERSSTTTSFGDYSIGSLSTGTHRLGVVPQTFWERTTPLTGLVHPLATGQNKIDANIGFRSTAPTHLRAGRLGPEFRLNTHTAGDQEYPQVASDTAGNFVTVWQGNGAAGRGIYGQRYNAQGQPAGAEFQVAQLIGFNGLPSVAMEPDGDFIVVWSSGDPAVHARLYSAAGEPRGSSFVVAQGFAASPGWADVAADADGDLIIVWQARDVAGGGFDIYAQRYSSAGTRVGDVTLLNSRTVGEQTRPAVAMDADGDFAVSWLSGEHVGSGSVLFRRFNASGQPVTGEVSADPTAFPGSYNHLNIAMDAAGNTVVVFTGGDIRARRFDPQGIPQGEHFLVSTFNQGEQLKPVIAIAPDGGFVVAWDDYNREGMLSGVYAQYLNAAGVRLGNDFHVNTTTANSQYVGGVAFQGSGFVVTWQSLSQDGSGHGAYAQRYDVFAPGAVGGRVFVDDNNNGVRDPAEAGRSGVQVRMLDAQGALIALTSTAADGTYRFSEVRPATPYTLHFTPPPVTALSAKDQGGNDTLDSDPDPVTGVAGPVTLAAGQFDLTWDAGLVRLASVSGAVYFDADADGQRDGGEGGLPGWTVYLDGDNDGRLDPGERTVPTTAEGGYSFTDLRPGIYRIGIVPRRSWQMTVPEASLRVTLAVAQNVSGFDVGQRATAPITYATPVGPEISLPGRDEPATAPMPGGGYVMAYWADTNNRVGGVNLDIYLQRFDAAGAPVGGPIMAHAPRASNQTLPAVAASASGDFVVTWVSDGQDGDGLGVFARRFSADGAPLGDEFQVNTRTTRSQSGPAVSVNDAGAFVIAWTGQEPTGFEWDVYAQRFDAAGNKLGGEFRANATTDRTQWNPNVAIDGDGDFAIGWQSGNLGSPFGQYGSRYQRFSRDGLPAGPEVAAGETAVALAMTEAGDLLVAHQLHLQGSHIVVRRFAPDGAADEPFIQASTTSAGHSPVIAVAESGDFVVAWLNNDGGGTGLIARRFTASGLPVGGEFRVNTTTPGDQNRASVILLNAPSDGNLLFTWRQENPSVVRTQRYEQYPAASTVGGAAWLDTNGDGLWDLTEPPAEGVPVTLANADGAHVASTLVSSAGLYRFPDLRPGTPYRITFTTPGRVSTLADQGDDSSDSDAVGNRISFTAPAAGTIRLDFGAGFTAPASIAGVKFSDRDADGQFDPGEAGLGSWVIFLDADGDGVHDPFEASQVTAADGSFRFSDVSPGLHRVRAAPQQYWTATTPPASPDVTISAGENRSEVNIGSHTSVADTRHFRSGAEQRPNVHLDLNQIAPAIATDADGDYAVVWTSELQDGSGEGVYGRLFSAAGTPRGGEFRVNSFTAGDQNAPSVAMNASGDFVVAWTSAGQDGDGLGVYAQRFNAAGEKQGGEFRVNASPLHQQDRPQVVSDAAGNFLVTWRHIQGNSVQVVGQRFDASGQRSGGEFLASTTATAYDHAISMDAEGNFVLAWRFEMPAEHQVFARYFAPDATPRGTSFQVTQTFFGRDFPTPRVAMTSQGRFVIAWRDINQVLAQRYDASARPIGAPLVVMQGYSVYPAIAAAVDGSFLVMWTAAADEIYARRYNAAGVPQGPAFLLSNSTVGNQWNTVAAMESDGDFVAAWNNQTPGTWTDVAAQQFRIDRGPTSSAVADVVVNLGAPDTLIDLFAAFADDRDPDAQLLFSLTGNTNPALFTSATIDPAAGTLRLNYSDAAVGTADLTVRATDRSGLFTETTFAVTVRPVINGTSGPDTFLVRPDGDSLHLWVNASAASPPTHILPLASLPPLTLGGGAGVTTLRIEGTGAVGLGATPAPGRLAVTGESVNLSVEGAIATLHDLLQFGSVHLGAGSRIDLTPGGDKVLRAQSVATDGGLLDLADNTLVIYDPAADAAARAAMLSQVLALVRSARRSGNWDGTTGITSSTAKADARRVTGLAVLLNDRGDGNPLLTTYRGQNLPVGAILVSHALNGDTDLSGSINADDFMRTDRGFLAPAGAPVPATWSRGDFNHDEKVNIEDYFLLDVAFSMQSPAPAIGSSSGAGSQTVPEPPAVAGPLPTVGFFDPPLELEDVSDGFDFNAEPSGVLGS